MTILSRRYYRVRGDEALDRVKFLEMLLGEMRQHMGILEAAAERLHDYNVTWVKDKIIGLLDEAENSKRRLEESK